MGATGTSIPKVIAAKGVLARFFYKRRIESQDAFALFAKCLIDELAVEPDKIERLCKLPRVGVFAKVAVARKVAEVDFSAGDQDRREKCQQKLSLRLGYGDAVEYLFCQFHCAVSPVEGIFDLSV